MGKARSLTALLFQSHIGAIRIRVARLYERISNQHFNPTLVQLESIFALAALELGIHFNPTLVQLELFARLFNYRRFFYFNPTLVQLELLARFRWSRC